MYNLKKLRTLLNGRMKGYVSFVKTNKQKTKSLTRIMKKENEKIKQKNDEMLQLL